MSVKADIRLMLKATVVPLLFLLVCWLVWWADSNYHLHLYHYGVRPRTGMGLLGILFSPLIHDDSGLSHIFNNTPAVFVLMWALFYFYRDLAWKTLLGIWLIGGIWLWCLSRDAFHIGASGLIYGLASFLFFSGMFRKHIPLMALSLIVVFLYGSLVWGILPFDYMMGAPNADLSISFEGHFWGAGAGVLLAWFYRQKGPQRKKYQWEIEEEMGIEPPDLEGIYNEEQRRLKELEELRKKEQQGARINYFFREKREDKD